MRTRDQTNNVVELLAAITGLHLFNMVLVKVFIVTNCESPRREVVRSSAGVSGVYPPFLGSFA